jgi:hypothetical protein
MSLCKLATPVITPTLHDQSRTNLVAWMIAVNQVVRGVFAEWDTTFGFLFGVCDDATQKAAEHDSLAALDSVARLNVSRAAGFAWAPSAASSGT